jgi:hypothetical protein
MFEVMFAKDAKKKADELNDKKERLRVKNELEGILSEIEAAVSYGNYEVVVNITSDYVESSLINLGYKIQGFGNKFKVIWS